jgi:hypothetical protein
VIAALSYVDERLGRVAVGLGVPEAAAPHPVHNRPIQGSLSEGFQVPKPHNWIESAPHAFAALLADDNLDDVLVPWIVAVLCQHNEQCESGAAVAQYLRTVASPLSCALTASEISLVSTAARSDEYTALSSFSCRIWLMICFILVAVGLNNRPCTHQRRSADRSELAPAARRTCSWGSGAGPRHSRPSPAGLASWLSSRTLSSLVDLLAMVQNAILNQRGVFSSPCRLRSTSVA